MGIRGELFTTEVSAENRTYFFNVKENRLGDVFLQIVESKNTDGAGFDRHAIVIFEDEMQNFLQGFEQTLGFIEKNRKERLKTKQQRRSKEKPISSKKVVKRDSSAAATQKRQKTVKAIKKEKD
ncbi:DUF3276 family protein [Treponema phagedenis]|uniref:DUF3276 family protein n=1 Tax=Treponema phagedenis TaxID=162 RepID=A0A0B7GV56_TREPH|nr:DUF3276 family protein [Treponema phagedenis]EFW38321.1 hypothetical protein HMPREF9554_01171 [Treponema phagedenis F0421]NVP25044.1 DUF3276 family protein [Treponema phagedenis]QEJ94042.1 DUF3276 family protein [Treponema phagedenis]QEJ97159.1 DUF3276 family protein [Treponema phagedenis]QEK01948.1 DUF3276 family protein [Treponema phagedenis]